MKEHSRLKELAKNLLEGQSRGFACRARTLNGVGRCGSRPRLTKLIFGYVELRVMFYLKPPVASRSPNSEWHDGQRRLL